MFNNNNNNNNNNNYLHLGTHRSHQCQGFHATPANTPTLWGGRFKLYQISKRLFATTHTQLPAL